VACLTDAKFAGANTFQDGVRIDAVGEFLDPRDAIVATLGNDVRGAELLG
jgi:hypothetical protein